jgi:hypothetical protein
MLNTRESAHCGSPGHGHGAWHTAHGLQRLAHRVHTPGVHGLLACRVETLEACGLLMPRTDLCVQDEWRRRGGTAHRRAPAAVGRAPLGPAHGTALLSQPKGLETARGVLAIAAGLVTRPGERAHGGSLDRGAIDRGESTRARPAGQWHGVPAVGCDPVARLLGEQRGGHPPALVAFFHAITVEPRAARAGFIAEAAMVGVGWPLADHLSAITLAGADGPTLRALGAVIRRHVRHRDGVLVTIHATAACARVRPG